MRLVALLLLLLPACAEDTPPPKPVRAVAGDAGANVPVCDVSALPGALDDERCMKRLAASNLRYKHGVLGTRLERMKGPAIAGLRARHMAWSLAFEAAPEERALAALELYEIAIEMAIINRGGPRWDNEPDDDGTPVVANPEADDPNDLGTAPLPDKVKKTSGKGKDKAKPSKPATEYERLYKSIGRTLKKAKLGKADRLVMAYKSLDYKAGLKDVKVRHSYIATLKTIERQLKARPK